MGLFHSLGSPERSLTTFQLGRTLPNFFSTMQTASQMQKPRNPSLWSHPSPITALILHQVLAAKKLPLAASLLGLLGPGPCRGWAQGQEGAV